LLYARNELKVLNSNELYCESMCHLPQLFKEDVIFELPSLFSLAFSYDNSIIFIILREWDPLKIILSITTPQNHVLVLTNLG